MILGRSQLLLSVVLSSALVVQSAETFLWDQLTPSEDLQWVQCYSTFQCARLEVPFDYSNENVGTAAIAIEAPGGSGVDTIVSMGASFQVILGNESSLYDIVGFDPRGVRYSTPIASFFETDAERALWNAGSLPTSLNASSNAIPNAWGRAHLLGALAAQRDASQILKYLTTDNVARDMLRITQKFGFDKLQYYGVSYGSILGATFAALFPDKVERIIIDGVLDPEAWFSANLTIEATDTDKALLTFFDGCAAAGPDLCAFYRPTAAAIAERLTALTDSIRMQPVPAITPAGYGLVDYSLLRMTIFESLYDLYSAFPALARGLAALENGDGTVLYSILAQAPFQCDNSSEISLPIDDSPVAIQCGDAVEVTDSIQQLVEYYENSAKTSQFTEFLVGTGRISCSGWQVYREGRFLGPVSAANTSFPLLLIANTADPVTPKIAALKAQAGFPGSVLLTQDSPGHTSATAPSLCTYGYIREYLVNGVFPTPGTICSVDATLFEPSATNSTKRAVLNADEMDLLAAIKDIGDSVRSIRPRFGN
ncbi:AB hydrolase-1 domain-containing protein [Mycena sanguinolenta]|uniref:AB hydrolase-1 domain-containing protein n=1 Tax=Mycena sanguinolenta TaxID=230812 RepID=A0A8H7D9X8_9AGAR|nr:AB hydrolase-1 domain-containing protein [Mycena sanguinolenta]